MKDDYQGEWLQGFFEAIRTGFDQLRAGDRAALARAHARIEQLERELAQLKAPAAPQGPPPPLS